MAARGIYHDLLEPPLEGKGYEPIAGSLGTPPVHLPVFPKIEDRPEAEPGGQRVGQPAACARKIGPWSGPRASAWLDSDRESIDRQGCPAVPEP